MIYIIWFILRIIYKLFMLLASVMAFIIINISGFVLLFKILPYKFRYISLIGLEENDHYITIKDFMSYNHDNKKDFSKFDFN